MGIESRHAAAAVDYKATQARAEHENALVDWINKKLTHFGKRKLVLRRRPCPGAADYEFSVFDATTGAVFQADADPQRIYAFLVSRELQ